MAEPNADLLLALSQLRGTPTGVYPAGTFTIPSPVHGCIAGKKITHCTICAGRGRAPRTGKEDGAPCPACLGRGFQTSFCGICAASLEAALDFHRDAAQRAEDDAAAVAAAIATEQLPYTEVRGSGAEAGGESESAGEVVAQDKEDADAQKKEKTRQKKKKKKKKKKQQQRGSNGGFVTPTRNMGGRRRSGGSGAGGSGGMMKSPDTPIH